MKQDPLGTVKRLIALAVTGDESNIDERRNAALSACLLIEQYKLLDAPPSFAGLDLQEILFGTTRPQRTRARPPPPPPSTPPPAEPPPQPTVRTSAKRPLDPDAKLMALNHNTHCRQCGQQMLRGRLAMWSRGELFHPGCYRNATE